MTIATKHKFWMPGEPECPRELKAPNGELHTLRCKVCGQENPDSDACAALSVRVPEGDMARALEWLRGFGWVVPDTVKSAIEEAIAAYDPERAGAFSGVKSGRVAWVLVQRHWVENVGYAASMLENSESRIDQLQAPALRKLIAEMAAAPSAKGVE